MINHGPVRESDERPTDAVSGAGTPADRPIPIRQTPLNDLRQVIEICVCYGDTKNVAADSAQQQLQRIQGLVMRALAKLEEPHATAVTALAKMVGEEHETVSRPLYARWLRDTAAVVIHNALTWGIGDDL